MRDHLGNTRVTFRDGINKGEAYFDWTTYTYVDPNAGNTIGLNDGVITSADIMQINNYYPFGLNMEGNWNGAKGDNKYGYNGKEWNDDFGLGLNDYGARWYDPMIDRWWNLDPESESGDQINWNPYHYVYDNPVKNIDPDGREGEGCCGGIGDYLAGAAGVVVGVADNMMGTSFRDEVGKSLGGSYKQSFQGGLDVADKGSLVAGATMVAGGVSMIEGGAVATVTGVGAVGGVATMGAGLAVSAEGGFMMRNAAKNLENSRVKASQNNNANKQEGSYTNTHQSGKKYHGKGDEPRAAQSGKNKAKEHNDPVKSTDWTPSKNKREAFKDESRRLQKDGGHKNPNNYNKKDSPGTKYRKQDNDH